MPADNLTRIRIFAGGHDRARSGWRRAGTGHTRPRALASIGRAGRRCLDRGGARDAGHAEARAVGVVHPDRAGGGAVRAGGRRPGGPGRHAGRPARAVGAVCDLGVVTVAGRRGGRLGGAVGGGHGRAEHAARGAGGDAGGGDRVRLDRPAVHDGRRPPARDHDSAPGMGAAAGRGVADDGVVHAADGAVRLRLPGQRCGGAGVHRDPAAGGAPQLQPLRTPGPADRPADGEQLQLRGCQPAPAARQSELRRGDGAGAGRAGRTTRPATPPPWPSTRATSRARWGWTTARWIWCT